MKKSILLLIIYCAIVAGSNAQTADRQEMMKDAGNQLKVWLNKIPGGSEQKYGFNNREEFPLATLGKPCQVFSLTGDFFKEELRPGKNYLETTGEWRIPVMVNQENRAVLTLVKKKNKWKVVSLGARVLARELQELEKYPGLGQSENLRMLRVYQLQSDFLLEGDPFSSAVEITVYPMHSAVLNMQKIREGATVKLGLNELLTFIKESTR